MGDLRTTGTPEFPSTPVQSRTSLERQSTKGCRESAPSECLDHLPHGTPLEGSGGLEGTAVGEGSVTGLAHRQGMAVPDVVAVNGRPGSQPRQGPSTHPADSEGAQGDHPVAVCAVHDPQVPREQSHERNLGQSVGLSARGIGSHGGLAQSMARLGDTLQLLGATDHWNPASQRFTPPLTSSGARAEIDQQLVRLRLLNSSNTCYMNAAVVAWLHITNRLKCSDRQADGSRMQPWRDIMQSLRPLHVHTLASWRNILAGWRDLHRQQDASEFLEYWVAVGRPQAVVGTWEARIENQQLIKIRHHSPTDVALDLDLEQSHTPQSLQQLIFAWHTQQLGIQALQNPPVILMIRLSRFRQVQGQMQKVTTPVIITPRVNIPVFDDDTLQCTNVPYHVWSVILHAGHSPQQATTPVPLTLPLVFSGAPMMLGRPSSS